MNAFYDLRVRPPSFSFMEFVCAAVTEGASHIIIYAPYTLREYEADWRQRVQSIIPQTCQLFGVTHEFGELNGREAIVPSHLPDGWIDAYKRHGRIAKVKCPQPPKSERFTVTIRDMNFQEQRNSGDDWRRFAEEIGAFVIEDYRTKPIDMIERLSYYAGAEMNYFVVNGPMHLCIFSDYPYAIFMKNAKQKKMERAGWPFGGNLWFANERQRCFWQTEDSYENLRKVHDAISP